MDDVLDAITRPIWIGFSKVFFPPERRRKDETIDDERTNHAERFAFEVYRVRNRCKGEVMSWFIHCICIPGGRSRTQIIIEHGYFSTYCTIDDTFSTHLTMDDLLLHSIMVSTIYVQLGTKCMLNTNTRFAMCASDRGQFSTVGTLFTDIHVIETTVMR